MHEAARCKSFALLGAIGFAWSVWRPRRYRGTEIARAPDLRVFCSGVGSACAPRSSSSEDLQTTLAATATAPAALSGTTAFASAAAIAAALLGEHGFAGEGQFGWRMQLREAPHHLSQFLLRFR